MDHTTPRRERPGPPERSYPFIRAWGHLMGSDPSHVNQQIALAGAEGAPVTAVYRTVEGTWATTADITRADTRRDLGLDPLPARAPTATELVGHLRDLIAASQHLRDVHGLREITPLDNHGLRLVFTGTTAQLHLDITGPDTTFGTVRQDSASQDPRHMPSAYRRPIRPRGGDHDNPTPDASQRPT